MDDNDGFVLISKEIVFEERIPAKMLLVLAYLRLNCSVRLTITSCVRWIAAKIGLQPKSGVGNSLDQMKEALHDLRRFGAIDFADFSKSTEMIDIALNDESEFFHPSPPYVRVDFAEFEKITRCSYQRKDNLLVAFLTVKGMMLYDSDKQQYGYCYSSEQTLLAETNKAISVTHNTLRSLLDILCESGLLNRYSVGGYLIRDDDFRLFPTFYSLGSVTIDEKKCEEIARKTIETRYGIAIDCFIKPSEAEAEKEEASADDFNLDAMINSTIGHITLNWR